jgi:hypothetical protein
MAAAVCRAVGMHLLVADAAKPVHDREGGPAVFDLVQREARLQGAAVLWKNFDVLLAEERKPGLASFVDALGTRPALTFLAGEARWEPNEALRAACWVSLELRKPSWAERLALWSAALDGHGVDADVDLGALATTFKFTGGQVRDAAAMAVTLACLRDSERPASASPTYTRPVAFSPTKDSPPWPARSFRDTSGTTSSCRAIAWSGCARSATT